MINEDNFLRRLFLEYSENRSTNGESEVGVFVSNDTLILQFWTDPKPRSAWVGSSLSICPKDAPDYVLWKITRNEEACNGMLNHTIYEAPDLHQVLRDQMAELVDSARREAIRVDEDQRVFAQDLLRSITTSALLF